MLNKNDLLLLLTTIQKEGKDVKSQINKLLTSPELSTEVIKFVNDNRPLEITQFYEQLRKSYNNKRSSLYINLVKEPDKPFDVLTTLSSLNLQLLLFAKHLDEKSVTMFFSHSRAEEISRVLNNYYKTYDLKPIYTILKLIRSDIKAFEYIK
jgi:hypothetical protein